jgi:hypothetical protein
MNSLKFLENKLQKIRLYFNDTQISYAEAWFSPIFSSCMEGYSEELTQHTKQSMLLDFLAVCADLYPWLDSPLAKDVVADFMSSKSHWSEEVWQAFLGKVHGVLHQKSEGDQTQLDVWFLKFLFYATSSATVATQVENKSNVVLGPQHVLPSISLGKRWQQRLDQSLNMLDAENSQWGFEKEVQWSNVIAQSLQEISDDKKAPLKMKLGFAIFQTLRKENLESMMTNIQDHLAILEELAVIRYLSKKAPLTSPNTLALEQLAAAGLIFVDSPRATSLKRWGISVLAYPFVVDHLIATMTSENQDLGRIINMPEALQVLVLKRLPRSKLPWLYEQLQENTNSFTPGGIDLVLQKFVQEKYRLDELPNLLVALFSDVHLPAKRLLILQHLSWNFPEKMTDISQSLKKMQQDPLLKGKLEEISLRQNLLNSHLDSPKSRYPSLDPFPLPSMPIRDTLS